MADPVIAGVGSMLAAAVSVAGLYLAHSYRRQVTLHLADKRLDAYRGLWTLTEIASPTRIEFDKNPITASERQSLHECMTSWYYANGNGMFLTGTTRRVYLASKSNLICPPNNMKPFVLRNRLVASADDDERIRGEISMRQLSLLRAQMKTDLAIYGRPFGPTLDSDDKAFLRYCGVSLWRRPWRTSGGRAHERQA